MGAVRGDIDTTPTGAKWTGEYVTWGGREHKVFIEREERAEMEELPDPHTGGPMYKRGPGGTVLNATMKRRVVKGYVDRRFILNDTGNGMTWKVYEPDYLPDPQEAERKQREARRAAVIDQLFEASEKLGGIDKVLGAITEAAEEQEDAEYPKPLGRGWWLLSNGMKVRGDEEVARVKEAALSTQDEAA